MVWAPEAAGVWDKIAHDEPLTRRLTVDAISAGKPPGSGGGRAVEVAARPQTQEEAAVAAGLCT